MRKFFPDAEISSWILINSPRMRRYLGEAEQIVLAVAPPTAGSRAAAGDDDDDAGRPAGAVASDRNRWRLDSCVTEATKFTSNKSGHHDPRTNESVALAQFDCIYLSDNDDEDDDGSTDDEYDDAESLSASSSSEAMEVNACEDGARGDHQPLDVAPVGDQIEIDPTAACAEPTDSVQTQRPRLAKRRRKAIADDDDGATAIESPSPPPKRLRSSDDAESSRLQPSDVVLSNSTAAECDTTNCQSADASSMQSVGGDSNGERVFWRGRWVRKIKPICLSTPESPATTPRPS